MARWHQFLRDGGISTPTLTNKQSRIGGKHGLPTGRKRRTTTGPAIIPPRHCPTPRTGKRKRFGSKAVAGGEIVLSIPQTPQSAAGQDSRTPDRDRADQASTSVRRGQPDARTEQVAFRITRHSRSGSATTGAYLATVRSRSRSGSHADPSRDRCQAGNVFASLYMPPTLRSRQRREGLKRAEAHAPGTARNPAPATLARAGTIDRRPTMAFGSASAGVDGPGTRTGRWRSGWPSLVGPATAYKSSTA
jgi:hypothetical protein